MAYSRGKASPNAQTKLRLFADSGGFCQNPDCNANLFLSIGDTDFHIAEMAHVFCASDKGPRMNSRLSAEERGCYSNLILLCPTCHTKIDKAENEYPDTLIFDWKTNHVNKIKNLFGVKTFSSRECVRTFIIRFLGDRKSTRLNSSRQHVSDFENKHINNSEENGIKFPAEINNIFK